MQNHSWVLFGKVLSHKGVLKEASLELSPSNCISHSADETGLPIFVFPSYIMEMIRCLKCYGGPGWHYKHSCQGITA